jgi:hypothetical protein
MEWVGTAGTGDDAEPPQTEPGANTARAAEVKAEVGNSPN